jgi:hypothetical protein
VRQKSCFIKFDFRRVPAPKMIFYLEECEVYPMPLLANVNLSFYRIWFQIHANSKIILLDITSITACYVKHRFHSIAYLSVALGIGVNKTPLIIPHIFVIAQFIRLGHFYKACSGLGTVEL